MKIATSLCTEATAILVHAEPNVGNGYNFDHYTWTQTLSDVFLTVPVPPGTRGKQCDVQILRKSLKVGIRGQEPILNGKLSEAIKEEDCTWAMDGNNIDITLQKFKGMTWWKAVLEGEPEINTQKVQSRTACDIASGMICDINMNQHCIRAVSNAQLVIPQDKCRGSHAVLLSCNEVAAAVSLCSPGRGFKLLPNERQQLLFLTEIFSFLPRACCFFAPDTLSAASEGAVRDSQASFAHHKLPAHRAHL